MTEFRNVVPHAPSDQAKIRPNFQNTQRLSKDRTILFWPNRSENGQTSTIRPQKGQVPRPGLKSARVGQCGLEACGAGAGMIPESTAKKFSTRANIFNPRRTR